MGSQLSQLVFQPLPTPSYRPDTLFGGTSPLTWIQVNEKAQIIGVSLNHPTHHNSNSNGQNNSNNSEAAEIDGSSPELTIANHSGSSSSSSNHHHQKSNSNNSNNIHGPMRSVPVVFYEVIRSLLIIIILN